MGIRPILQLLFLRPVCPSCYCNESQLALWGNELKQIRYTIRRPVALNRWVLRRRI